MVNPSNMEAKQNDAACVCTPDGTAHARKNTLRCSSGVMRRNSVGEEDLTMPATRGVDGDGHDGCV